MSTKTYRRTQPIAAYLLLLSVSIGAYFLYVALVVPILEVPTVARKSQSISEDQYTLVGEDKQHHQWFADDKWERQPCSVLQTAQGKILFDDFKKEDETTWLVFPFSMVLDRETEETNAGDSLPPIVLRCETGARLRFDQPVSAIGGSSNFRLKSAQLEGKVELYRRKAPNQSQEDLRIETSNIQITDEQIITIDDVAFWFGNNQGIGRNLSIQLSHRSASNRVTQDFSKINGITNIRLAHLSTLQIRPTSKPNRKSERMLSNDSTPIEITAAGPFDFDFKSNIARFQERVQVRKLDTFGDRLNCEQLILKFNSTQNSGAIALDSATDSEFELESIFATGAPAVLSSNSQNAQIKGQSLQYDLVNQIIKASAPNQVSITKDDSHFVSRSVEYRLTDDKKLGSLSASGPGHLIRDNGPGKFRASWSEALILKRVSDQQHAIRVSGNAKLNLDTDTSLTAEEIELSLWEVPVFGPNDEFVRWAYQPNKLLASNKVHISSEKLIADATQLVATWPNNPKAESQIINQIGANTFNGRFDRQIAQSEINRPNFSQVVRRVSFQPIAANLPIIAKGNLIDVVVDDQNGDSKIVNLNISGDVNVSKPSTKHPELAEFEIYGESLQMIPQGSDGENELYRIHIDGTPKKIAQILSEKVHLFGTKIVLDQTDNRMWVDGTGQIKLHDKANSQPQQIYASTNANQIDRLDVKFGGGMIFDGKQIYFEHDIVADIAQQSRGNHSTTNAVGNALRITLDQNVDFKNLEASPQEEQPQIVDMIFRSTVPSDQIQFKQVGHPANITKRLIVQNQKYDSKGNVLEKMTLSSPHVAMTQAKNELLAAGPGYVQIHRKGQNGNPTEGLGFVGNRNSSSKRDRFTYIQTNFDEQLLVNIRSNEITMTGNLRSVFAPVSTVRQTFNPDHAGRLPVGSVRLNCQRIDIVRSDNPLSPKPESEFIASGSAKIVSDSFATAAQKISYRQDTDTLHVAGTPGKNVVLKFRRENQLDWDTMVGSSVTYHLGTQTANAENVERIDASFGKLP